MAEGSMNPRYKPRRQVENAKLPWKKTPGGLRVIELADVPPVLDAYDRADGNGLAVWCLFCQCWYWHGHGAGRRIAHCHIKESSYLRSGYTLRAIDRPVPTFKNGRPQPPAARQVNR